MAFLYAVAATVEPPDWIVKGLGAQRGRGLAGDVACGAVRMATRLAVEELHAMRRERGAPGVIHAVLDASALVSAVIARLDSPRGQVLRAWARIKTLAGEHSDGDGLRRFLDALYGHARGGPLVEVRVRLEAGMAQRTACRGPGEARRKARSAGLS